MESAVGTGRDRRMSPAQRALWDRVVELWACTRARDVAVIAAALDPDYVGWDLRAPAPHDRDAALASVGDDAPALGDYRLVPLSVRVYDGHTGVAHYRYCATVLPAGDAPVHVQGRWTEVYVLRDGQWYMVAVSGQPDERAAAGSTAAGSTAGAMPAGGSMATKIEGRNS